jgi:arylsulfatase A
VWEGGFRVPYLVRWPGHVPAGTVCDETISIVDTLASVAKITGYELPKVSEGAEDSHDVSKAWLGKMYEGSLRPDVIVHSADGVFAIRKGPHKWIEGVPADDVKPAAKKAHGAQYQRMLFDLKNDIAEEKEISAAHPDVVKELEALLNRYRDGGYSRELPPAGVKPKAAFEPLPPLKNAEPVDLTKFKGWTQRDGAWFAKAGDKGMAFSGPLTMQNGVLQFQIRLGEADRHSLRIHTADNAHSFRVVLSRAFIDIAKNPSKGENAAQTLPLGKTRVRFKSSDWLTVRLTFQNDELTAECAGTTTKAKHAVFAAEKAQANFIAFEGEVGLRGVQMARR